MSIIIFCVGTLCDSERNPAELLLHTTLVNVHNAFLLLSAHTLISQLCTFQGLSAFESVF